MDDVVVETIWGVGGGPGSLLTRSRTNSRITVDSTMEDHIGPYTLLEQIGEGNWGEVRRAQDQQGRHVAIKIIFRQRLTRKIKDGYKRLLQEYELVRGLDHPNIVKYLDLIETDDLIYLVMEEGGISLDQIVQEDPQRVTPYFIKLIMVKLLQCLVYLESKHIAHHDIKLANILVDSSDRLLLVDLGVAEGYSPAIGCQSFFGTPAHQGPEIAGNVSGASFDGPKAEVWAAGVLLYYLVTGQYPFKADTVYLLLKAIEEQPVVIPRDLDPDLRDLLARMLEKDPLKRISPSAALQHPWLTQSNSSIKKTSFWKTLLRFT